MGWKEHWCQESCLQRWCIARDNLIRPSVSVSYTDRTPQQKHQKSLLLVQSLMDTFFTLTCNLRFICLDSAMLSVPKSCHYYSPLCHSKSVRLKSSIEHKRRYFQKSWTLFQVNSLYLFLTACALGDENLHDGTVCAFCCGLHSGFGSFRSLRVMMCDSNGVSCYWEGET